MLSVTFKIIFKLGLLIEFNMADDKQTLEVESVPNVEKEDSPERSPAPPADKTSPPASPTSKGSQSGENRLRPASGK